MIPSTCFIYALYHINFHRYLIRSFLFLFYTQMIDKFGQNEQRKIIF